MIKFANCKCEVEKGKFDVNNIPLDCPATWRLISHGHTVGVFQLEKKLGQDWAEKAKPSNIEELSALVSILRPGPLECIGENTLITQYRESRGANRRGYCNKTLTIKELYDKHRSLQNHYAKMRKSGENHPCAKLSQNQANQIRQLLNENKLTQKKIAEIFDLKQAAISKIKCGKTYNCNKIVDNEITNKLNIISFNEQTGQLFKNKINDVILKGVGDVYSIKVRTSWTFKSSPKWLDIKATLNHSFLTNSGWRKLRDIKFGDYIAIFTGKKAGGTRSNNSGKNIPGYKNFRNIAFYNWQYHCVCCDWSEASLDVNHIDGNRSVNNDPENLVWLCPNHHRMYSEGKLSKNTMVQNREKYRLPKISDVRFVRIEEIKYEGTENLYDISVSGPHHNYLAGNFVVHNSGMSQDYVDIKFNKKQKSYIHPALKPILDPTFGCLVYQEQAIRIATDLAGFSPENADELRKAIGKKKPELMAKIKAKFVKGAQEYGKIDHDIAEEIFGWIEKCQRYSFNKCISSETIIRKCAKGRYLKNDGYTVEHMYRIKNDTQYAKKHGHESLRKKWKYLGHYGFGLSLCSDGRIRPNIIRNIQSLGYMNMFKLTLENNATIRVTANHKFPTPKGEKLIGQLSTEDEIYVCGQYEESDFNRINRFSAQSSQRNKSYGTRCGFPSGQSNPGYTNGSFTDFVKYKEDTNNVCEECGKTDCRIETAHINGDRTNSSRSNLKNLCVSCHKKHDYLQGRVRRGEKGYPSEIMKIKSIEPDGVDHAWDVTMDGPHHNFVVDNGIVTCNSHAVGYALGISYPTAWLKCHFPHEFFTSYLTYSQYKGDPKEEIYKLVQDARLFNVDILPPDIRRGNIHFRMTESPQKGVAFGLAHVRGVGASAIQKIVTASKETSGTGSLNTWGDFLAAVPDFHRNVGIALIKSGACDCYGVSRSEMVRELEVVLGTAVRDSTGKKVEVKGLTNKEKVYFFENISYGEMNAREVLLQMAEPPGNKTKTIKQMTKKELVAAAAEYLDQASVAFGGIVDGDSKFVYTSEAEKKAWLENIGNRTKQKIEALMLQNRYKDIASKPPCSSDARRKVVAKKAEMLEKSIEDTNTANATAEKHFLGISLSCSQADDADNTLATHTCLEIAKASNGEEVAVCAIIDNVKHTKTKRGRNPGQPMCFLTMSDSTYSIDHAVVFPDAFDRLKAFCKEDLICLVYGEKKNGSFIIRDIQKLM